MTQYDWERMHEDLEIADVERINFSSWFVAENEYVVNVGSKMNGTYIDTQTVGGQCESFIEGLNWWDSNYSYRKKITIVNNAALPLSVNYSVSVTTDTASLVSDGKVLSSGDDLRIVYWSGNSWIELDRLIINMNSNSTQILFRTQAEIPANDSDGDYYVYYGNPGVGNPPSNESNVYLWVDDFNRADNPDITTEASYSLKTGGGTWSIETNKLKNVGAAGDPNKLIITAIGNANAAIDMLAKIEVASFSGGDLSRMGLSCCIDASPSRGSGYCALFHQNRNSLDFLNDLRSWGTKGTFSWSLNTWYYMRFRVIDPASKAGKVKVWEVGTAEPSTWTVDGNFGSGAARSYGEVGFTGSRTTDTTYFDDILIRYIVDPEPSASVGTEESQGSNRLDVDGAFLVNISTYPLNYVQTVEIQMMYRSSDMGEKLYLKAYNWTSSTYSDAGFNSTDGHTPATEWSYYAVNLTDQWSNYVDANGTIYVKVVDEGPDATQTTIAIDFLAVRVAIDGMKLTFENKEALSCHLVSLWVNNSTHHRRYDINVFINSGEKKSYFRIDISLPQKPYIIKVVTERGNIAVYSDN